MLRRRPFEALIWLTCFICALLFSVGISSTASANTTAMPDAGFEDNSFSGWSRGSQTGNLGSTINGGGTGVTIFSGSRTFTHGPHGAMGSPTNSDGSPNPYYAPAVAAGSWTFGPNNATYAAALQPKGEQTFSQAMTALGLSGSPQTAIQAQLTADRNASGFGSPNPTDAAWITRDVELTAGTTYTMSWNYLGTDYVPYNDGSVTSLVPVNVPSTPVITVNNFERTYAMLGFTNPGTGDYSTNSYGATGWQTSTYEVSVTGTYKLGFAVFNLGDTALSPVLMIDNATGTTDRCAQNGTNCVSFGGVEANNETAPTIAPTTTTTTSTTTTSTTTTTTSTTTTTVPSLDNALWGQVNENETLTLSAPEGNVFTEVLFASYGLPNGADGNYTIGSCHATSSQTYVESIAIGESTVSIVASNSNFGDPCGGIGKNLKVALLYGAPTTAPASPYYNPVQNLTATANEDGSVTLDWDAPEASNLSPYMYSVSFYDLDDGVESGGWGVWTLASNTTYTLSTGMFSGNNPTTTGYGPVRFKVKAGSGQCVGVGSGDCVYGPTVSADATVVAPTTTTTTTTTSSTTTTTVYVVPTTTTSSVPQTTVPEPSTTSTTVLEPEEEDETTTTTIPLDVEEQPEEQQPEEPYQPEEIEEEPETSPTTIPSDDGESEGTDGQIPQESEDDIQEPSDETTQEAVEEVLENIENLSSEETEEFVTALIDELEEDKVAEFVETLIDGIADAASVDELTEEAKEQIAAVVEVVLSSGISRDVAETLASNAAVLESVTPEQAAQVFEQVDAASLTEEVAEQIVDAVQEAPSDIREAFEDVVDLFQGAFDGYKMLNQNISVGERRTVIAAGLLTASAATMAAAGGMPSGSPSSSGPSAPNTKQDTAARRDDEEEEPQGEIAGDGLDWIKKISIFKYVDGVKVMDWKAFIKKFSYGLMNMGFTIAGSLVVYLTLSGPIQKIAGISTVLAIGAAMWLHMKEPDSE